MNKVPFFAAVSFLLIFLGGVSFHFLCVQEVGNNPNQITQSVAVPKATKSKVCKLEEHEFEAKPNSCVDAILVYGEIDDGTISSFDKLYPDVKDHIDTVCFLSWGGGTQAALKLAKRIKYYELNTCIGEHISIHIDGEWKTWQAKSDNPALPYCKSICPFIMLAGKERIAIGEQFEIRVHHPGFTYCCLPEGENKFNSPFHNLPILTDDMEDLVELSEKKYHEKLFEFYDYAMSHGFFEKELLLVTRKELLTYQFFTTFH
jgi:hypothetical protein